MCQYTTCQPPAYIWNTPQDGEPEPEVNLRHDDLYARAWECEYEKPILDAEKNNARSPISSEIPVRSDLLTEETTNTQ